MRTRALLVASLVILLPGCIDSDPLEPDPDTPETESIHPIAAGDTIVGLDGIMIAVPAGAFEGSIEITIRRLDEDAVAAGSPIPEGWDLLGDAYGIEVTAGAVDIFRERLIVSFPLPEAAQREDLAPSWYLTGADTGSDPRKAVDPQWIPHRYTRIDWAAGVGMPIDLLTQGVRRISLLHRTGASAPFFAAAGGTATLLDRVDCGVDLLTEDCGEARTLIASLASSEEQALLDMGYRLGERDFTYHAVHCTDAAGLHLPGAISICMNNLGDPAFHAEVVRHEIFHEVQWVSSPVLWADGADWVVEGQAAAIQRADDEMRRTTYFSAATLDMTMDTAAYVVQDFWVFLTRAGMNGSAGSLRGFLGDSRMLNNPGAVIGELTSFGDLHDAHWHWVRNQAVERRERLGRSDTFSTTSCQITRADSSAFFTSVGFARYDPVDAERFTQTATVHPLSAQRLTVTAPYGGLFRGRVTGSPVRSAFYALDGEGGPLSVIDGCDEDGPAAETKIFAFPEDGGPRHAMALLAGEAPVGETTVEWTWLDEVIDGRYRMEVRIDRLDYGVSCDFDATAEITTDSVAGTFTGVLSGPVQTGCYAVEDGRSLSYVPDASTLSGSWVDGRIEVNKGGWSDYDGAFTGHGHSVSMIGTHILDGGDFPDIEISLSMELFWRTELDSADPAPAAVPSGRPSIRIVGH